MIFTFQTEILPEYKEYLEESAKYIGKIRCKLLSETLKDYNINEVKSNYIKKYKINARQFNSLYSEIKGIISSAGELKKVNIDNLNTKIKDLDKKIKSLTKKLSKVLRCKG